MSLPIITADQRLADARRAVPRRARWHDQENFHR